MNPTSISKSSLRIKVLSDFSDPDGTKDGMALRRLKMVKSSEDLVNKVQKLSIGDPAPDEPNKILLIVGATGTGKTLLINAMVNFIFNIEFTDNFRLLLIDDDNADQREQSESQTDLITAYVFNYMEGMPFSYNYILIDTPGFGDTRGIERDRQLMRQLESFLKQNYNITHVDSVGLVVQASSSRLTQAQRYVFDGLGSMFGKDVKENIYVMATFCDNKEPAVKSVLMEANVSYEGFYKFNNGALYANNKVAPRNCNQNDDSDDDDDGILFAMTNLNWQMGNKNMQRFFQKLGSTIPASLELTKQVLEERRLLQEKIIELQNQIHLGLSKLNNLHQERDMLKKIKSDVKLWDNYEEEIEVEASEKVTLEQHECITNCQKCLYTCHYPCNLPQTSNKERCWAMDNGVCRICPNKCPWVLHVNMKYRHNITIKKEKRTIQELLNRYKEGVRKRDGKKIVIQKIEKEIKIFSRRLVDLIKEAQCHVEKLEKIALKPNPISTIEYIDLLIESERFQQLHNFERRIKMLEKLKREVKLLEGIRGSSSLLHLEGENILEHFKKFSVN